MIKADGIGEYLCSTNVLKSHAVAYRLYEKKYKERFNGKVGIVFSSFFFYGNTSDVDRAMQFRVSGASGTFCLQLIHYFVFSLDG